MIAIILKKINRFLLNLDLDYKYYINDYKIYLISL